MEIDGSASAVALLGLDGFVVLAAAVTDGELHQLIETTAAVMGCGTCGVAARPHGRREVRVRDLPSGGRPVVLRWSKRVWRCWDPACPVRTWTETNPAVAARAAGSGSPQRSRSRRPLTLWTR